MRIPTFLLAATAATALALSGCGSGGSTNSDGSGGSSTAGAGGGGGGTPIAGAGGTPIGGGGGMPIGGGGGTPIGGGGGVPTAGAGGTPIAGAGGTSTAGAGGTFIAPDGGQGGIGGFPTTDAAPPPPPANPGDRATYNFNYGWKFIKAPALAKTDDPSVAAFNDAAWTDVSLPHTYNDVDNFGVNWVQITTGVYTGLTWYRKHFTIDAANQGRKVFLEFQGIRNTGTFYVNGTKVGFHQDEVSPAGLDITAAVKFGADNVIAVQVNGAQLNLDQTVVPGYSYDWSTVNFYPNYGGLMADSNLIITDTIHQTLPLWNNLQTQGVYVYADPTAIDTAAKSATVTVESEVQNETNAGLAVTLNMEVFDYDGKSVATATAAPQQVAAGAKVVIKAEKPLTGVHFWAPSYPYLYTVRSTISVGGKAGDSTDIPFGIRKFSFNATNGFKINGHSTYLAGFAPRTVMDWAGSGIPQDWMTEYDYLLMKGMNHFFIRPMHVAPRGHMVTSADRLGVVMVVPAGDGEGCFDMARWPQHLALMQAVMIYFRNSPSVAFYEGCNQGLTQDQILGMKKVRDTWDPHGSRYMGDRGTDVQNQPAMEYQSPMDDEGQSPTMPLWSAEYSRHESPRRVWDAYSPMWDPKTQAIIPSGGYIKIVDPRWGTTLETAAGNGIAQYPLCDFRQNSVEDLALCNVYRYWRGYSRSNFVEDVATRTSKGIQIGGAHIIYADSNTDGRLQLTETARVGGVLDGVRIIKENYYAMKVAASLTPDIHILGHWNYAVGTTKTVYVVSNTQSVTLATYDATDNLLANYTGAVDMQMGAANPNHYVFAFANVKFQQAGKIKAVGLNGGTAVVSDEHVTTGAAAGIRLTPVLGPQGWIADGADIAMVDVEVVDANGQRVPTDISNITFTHSGAGTWIGGFNSGLAQSAYPNQGIFKDALQTEGGINRVLVRSSRTAGTFTIKVSRQGLADATVTLASQAFPVPASNLATVWPQRYTLALPAEPAAVPDN